MDVFIIMKFCIVSILLALATGVLAFLPMLIVGIVAQLGYLPLGDAQWLAHPAVIFVLSLAAAAEIALEVIWGASHAYEATLAPVLKPMLAWFLTLGVLPPEVAYAVTALVVGVLPASLSWLGKLGIKLVAIDPFSNVLMAGLAITTCLALAGWAIWLVPSPVVQA